MANRLVKLLKALDLPGRPAGATIKELSEYLMRSNRLGAIIFQDWVFEEVLLRIRNTGGYLTAKTIEDLAGNLDLLISLAQRMKEKQRLQAQA